MKIVKLLILVVFLGGCSTKYYKQTARTACSFMVKNYWLAKQCKATAEEMIDNAEKNSEDTQQK